MDQEASERRVTSLVHVVFLASIGVFGLVLWFARAGGGAPVDASGRAEARAMLLLLIAAAECYGAERWGRRRLRSGSGDPESRVQAYFLIRFGAAEAAAVFGLMLGFTGGGAFGVGALFALSLGTLVIAAPTREAWARALAVARQ